MIKKLLLHISSLKIELPKIVLSRTTTIVLNICLTRQGGQKLIAHLRKKWSNRGVKKFNIKILPLVISLAVHAGILFIKLQSEPSLPQKKQVLKYRKVGKKDLLKDSPNLLAVPADQSNPAMSKSLLERIGQLMDKISPPPVKELKKQEQNQQAEQKRKQNEFQNQSRIMQAKVFNKIEREGDHAKILSNKGMGLDLLPPKGISEDELNSAEKKFYAFQKRVFENYLYSFLRVYKQLSLDRPALIRAVESSSHQLRGKVLYDDEGNILEIKIIRSSVDDNVHELFESTLKGMDQLSNPPRELLDENQQLPLFFKLQIN